MGSDDGSISLDDEDHLDDDDDEGGSDGLFEDESGNEEQDDSEDENGPPKSKKSKKIMSDKDFSRKLKNTDGKDFFMTFNQLFLFILDYRHEFPVCGCR